MENAVIYCCQYHEKFPYINNVRAPTENMYQIAEEKINKGLSPIAKAILAVFASLFGVGMILMAPSSENIAYIYTFGAFCILIAFICISKGRIRQFLGSILGMSLFGIAVVYIYSQFLTGPIDSGHRGEPSILNSILFLLAFGIPGISYALKVQFGFKNKLENK